MYHYSHGFIPGPTETKEEFEKRVEYCLSLRSILPEEAGIQVEEQQMYVKEAASYGINPFWVPLVFSNHQLAPWHGGCAWIFQMDDQTPLGAFLQLRKPFKTNQSYLGIYKRNELLAHEICHVARMAFDEPIFEEHFAYRTSASKWRKFIGPIIRNSIESMFFFLSLLLIFVGYLFALFVDINAWNYIPYLYLIPLMLTGFALMRLWGEHRNYEMTLDKLKVLSGSDAEQLMLWLTDKEIKTFSKKQPDEILDYFKSGASFRLQSLLSTYFPPGMTA